MKKLFDLMSFEYSDAMGAGLSSEEAHNISVSCARDFFKENPVYDAAPELLVELEADEAALQLSPLAFYAHYGYNISERGERRRAVIAKARGEQK